MPLPDPRRGPGYRRALARRASRRDPVPCGSPARHPTAPTGTSDRSGRAAAAPGSCARRRDSPDATSSRSDRRVLGHHRSLPRAEHSQPRARSPGRSAPADLHVSQDPSRMPGWGRSAHEAATGRYRLTLQQRLGSIPAVASTTGLADDGAALRHLLAERTRRLDLEPRGYRQFRHRADDHHS